MVMAKAIAVTTENTQAHRGIPRHLTSSPEG